MIKWMVILGQHTRYRGNHITMLKLLQNTRCYVVIWTLILGQFNKIQRKSHSHSETTPEYQVLCGNMDVNTGTI